MAKDQSQLDLTDMVQRMQAPFMGNEAVGKSIERLLEAQGSLLKEAEVFVRHWFERRNDAIETAINALHQMNSTGAADPAGAMRAMTALQCGVVERLSADVLEWTALCARVSGTDRMARPAAATMDADQAETDKTGGKGGADSKLGSAHATPV